jgi:hypothetical protein
VLAALNRRRRGVRGGDEMGWDVVSEWWTNQV